MENINLEKLQQKQDGKQSEYQIKYQAMETSMKALLSALEEQTPLFVAKDTFERLAEYAKKSDGVVLYSTISNYIYAKNQDAKTQNGKGSDITGVMLYNLDAMIAHSEIISNEPKVTFMPNGNNNEMRRTNLREMLLKMREHILLANHQYNILKEISKENDEKAKKQIESYSNEMTKKMNAQMITMVSIFTALAFLIFGSLSSLDGLFKNLEIPLFKALSMGLIWGLCVLNMIFVFLYCIGRLTKLDFRKNGTQGKSVFQSYPVVWWTNFILVALLAITSWIWIIQGTVIGNELLGFINSCPLGVFLAGWLIIFVGIWHGRKILDQKTCNK